MHVGLKIAIGAGIVGGGALLLAACGNKEMDADSYAVDKFGKFDKEPKDNKWTASEVNFTSRPRVSTTEHSTYRVGDYIFGTREIRETTTRNSMSRIFEAAKGNDAVLSLQELREFALKYDKDKNGTLNHDERKTFESAYAPTSRSTTVIIGSEPFSRYSPRVDYPDPAYPGSGGGSTSPGDDYGGGYNPGSGGGSTSPGDDGGSYIPPSSGGSGGGTSPGDSGGGSYDPPSYDPPSYDPPSYDPPSYDPPSSGSGNSTDNGNPDYDDF